ncbi:hypothetical protein [Anoxybacillus flavithermus]|uniref:hypothetical protein n=1 Tax=Anoxybacillus flavithermus TaxID=33934 RepID=UPI00030A1E72|nr:hypothetical protein [Anoxybacillus flavithermus]
MGYLCLIVLPIVAVFWFFNLAQLLETLHQKREVHNEAVLGTVMTMIFFFNVSMAWVL